ncbi:MAG: carbon-nitrogen hydrolase family protein [Proteobacteria bacterium]|nr:carbon-nitrogen hydrolase family protein [Pseudomonadota bacterium]MCZ6784928.1 carbon-nitrogen hydrolase family protein [Pseudomonadota bacterium]
MRVGVVQMTSSDDLAANLKAATELVESAAAQGAELVALPENFAYLRREGLRFPCAQGFDGEIVSVLSGLAREHGIWLLGGTFPEAIPGDERVYNTSPLVSPTGRIAAHYRKMHLFDVDLAAEGGGDYRESDTVAPGEEVVVADTPFGPLGLSICYDLRFPELYRQMADRGARWITVPSAFTPHTGRDHWEVLLRARAIENQAFVLAPAQCGRHGPDRASYGRSLILDPWGLVLAQATDRPGVIVADCRPEDQDRIRRSVPALSHRKL